MFGEQCNFHSTCDSSDDNHYTKKRKYKPYEEIFGEFKKIKHTKNERSSSSEVFGEQRNFHSTSDSSDDNHYTKKRKYNLYEEISREFKNIKPPTFNGETEKGEEAESWLSGMKKYFQIYKYSNQLKARMAIYNFSGKADIWWQDLKRVKGIREKNVNWSTFKKYFKKKFLSMQYYEERAKEFYELKLGLMTMKDLNSKFLSLLRYVPYLVDEKQKVQRFLSCLPYHIKDSDCRSHEES